ncbi:MAG: alpha/beta fold hydrolase [Leptospirales bacterium]|nr:alpha/beta fold hydrolase [Leptospirales bacterium]
MARTAARRSQQNSNRKKPASKSIKGSISKFKIESVSFVSEGETCRGDLYLPLPANRPPLVIMAHGFGGERTFALPSYAKYYAERGIAVLLFDYRCFGTSDGALRNWISPRRHKQDWRAAIRFGKTLPQIDADRIALWGTSLSAGHVVAVSAGRNDVRALSLLVPFSDGFSVPVYFPFLFVLKALLRGILDIVLSLFGKVYTVPIYEKSENFGLLSTPECWKGYGSIVDHQSSWRNLAPARIALTLTMYRPILHAKRVKCPVFIVAGEEDSLAPFPTVQKLARKIPGSMMMVLPTGHFETYTGDWFEKAAASQFQFLRDVLFR